MTSESAPDVDRPEDAGPADAEGTATARAAAEPDAPVSAPEGSDQVEMPFAYDHGRMPLFMKLIWIGFLAFATWYVVVNLFEALNSELGG